MSVTEPVVEVGQAWVSDMAFEDFATEDGRFVMADAIEWRDLPLTLMALSVTGPGGHEGAEVAGRIDRMSKAQGEGELEGITVIKSGGVFDTGEVGVETARLVGDQTLKGVSIDFIVSEYAFRDPDSGEIIEIDEMGEEEWERAFMGELQTAFKKLTITAATIVPTPAFAPANITLAADGQRTATIWFPAVLALQQESMTAAAAGLAPLLPPRDWFENPHLDGPTAMTVTPEGRVYGHLALWDSCHIADPAGPGVCVTPPHSATAYSYFHLGETETEDGDVVHTGKLTFDTGHADLRASRTAATRHYDNTGMVFADVRAGEDVYGIWFAGALRPDLDAERVRAGRAALVSGDWRRVGGSLELVAALGVNVPGYPVPRVAAVVAPDDGEFEVVTLAAAGVVIEEGQQVMSPAELDARMNALGILAGVTSLTAATLVEDEAPPPGLVDELRRLVADQDTMASSARGFHWNVQGSEFSEASELYRAIYVDVQASIEATADSIKQLGGYSPFALDELTGLRTVTDAPQDTVAAFDMTFQLRKMNERVLAQLNACWLAATAAAEVGISQFLAERIDVHQRWAQQLKVQLAA